MTFANSSGTKIFFEESGSGTTEFILVHGWCGDHTSMSGLANRLAQRHHVLNVDLRDRGLSDPSSNYSCWDVADDLVEVARTAATTKPIVVGHSQGGIFTLALSQRYPQFARSLVLLDPTITGSPERAQQRLATLDEIDGNEQLRSRLNALFIDTDDHVVREAILDQMLSTPRDVARRALVASDAVDTVSALRECEVPVLYIASATPHESPDYLLNLQPKLRFEQVPSGHFVQIFALEQVTEFIESFASGDAGTAPPENA